MNSKNWTRRKLAELMQSVCLACAVLTIAGCHTLAPTGEEIAPFQQGLVTADQQTSSTFADVNKFLRQQQVDRAVNLPTLSEDEFVSGLDAPELAKWRRAFGWIEAYADKLQQLLSPDRRVGVEGELSQLGATINQVRGEQLPKGLEAGFIQLGGFLVQLKANKDALEQIRNADPAIQSIFSAMMDAIGADAESGVRGTVADTWGVLMGRIVAVDFLRATGVDGKRAAVLRFVAAMDQRDAQDQMLGALRLSLSSLAKAHQELAAGRSASASALIRIVQNEYQAYREQVKTLRDAGATSATKGDAP